MARVQAKKAMFIRHQGCGCRDQTMRHRRDAVDDRVEGLGIHQRVARRGTCSRPRGDVCIDSTPLPATSNGVTSCQAWDMDSSPSRGHHRPALPLPRNSGAMPKQRQPLRPHRFVASSTPGFRGMWRVEGPAEEGENDVLEAAGAGDDSTRVSGSAAANQACSAGASQPATPVTFSVPPGACDCHTHVFGDPRRFPFTPARTYTPESASVDEMRKLHRALHTTRVVIVQPSVYGTDNACGA